MKHLDLDAVADYIRLHIGPEFHDKKIKKVNGITLDDILKRKNPYLFKAKGTQTAHDLLKSVLGATVSSGEETLFGNFLEQLAIYVNQEAHGGRKSGIKGVDLEFEEGHEKFLVSIKSGPNWGNSGQIENLIKRFNEAKKIISTSSGAKRMTIICVEGCCYGTDHRPEKGTHRKLCGQEFWSFISGGHESLYQELIQPLGEKAKEKNLEIETLLSEKLNLFTAEFVKKFCNKQGKIDWNALLAYNSGKNPS